MSAPETGSKRLSPIADFVPKPNEEFVGDATFTLSMTIILDRDSGDWDNFEVNDVEIILGLRWPHYENDWTGGTDG